jgi:hypothetical protein
LRQHEEVDRSGRTLRVVVFAIVVLGIASFVWATNRPEWVPTSIEGVVASSDSDEITVTVFHGICRRDPRVVVILESSSVVRLRAEQDEGGDCDSVGLTSEISVDLDAALDTKSIEVEHARGRVDQADLSCVVDGQPADRCTSIAAP